MPDPYLGEIRIFSFGFVPKDWAMCNGQTMTIQHNAALFSLLGTVYGGDGRTTFALPDLRARVPMHTGAGHQLGEAAGSDVHQLSAVEMPRHNHWVYGNSITATGNVPGPGVRLAGNEPGNLYGPPANTTAMDADAIGSTGGSGVHENRQPFLGLNFCMAVAGRYPSRSLTETS
jgi:microcystin-dependent protein